MKDIIIHPAKRVLALYFLSFILILAILVFLLDSLNQQLDLINALSNIIWKLAVFVGLSLLCYSFLWRLTSKYTISTECVAATIGIFSKNHIRIPLNRIVDYQVITPLLERLLGLGSIHIGTAGDENLVMQQVSKGEIEVAVLKLDKLLNKEQHVLENVVNLAT